MQAHLRRRGFVGGGLGLAATTLSSPAQAAAPATIKLRLLETSDLHMFVYDYDYYHEKPDATVGLSKVASLIAAARAQVPNSLLFDNGDIIQGSPLGDMLAQPGRLAPGEIHPMFAAMNRLGYDAATLGNHEFNFGLPFMDHAIAGANFPFVCANLAHVNGSSYLPPSMVITRAFQAEDGSAHTLRIGVTGFLPPQIMVWDRSNLEGRVTATDIVEAARMHVPALRAQCDVLVALCHSGIDTRPPTTGFENAAYHLAGVPGLDVIFTGHSHRVFPGPDYDGRPGVDSVRGTLAGVPAVMPGFWGSHLGIIDLALQQSDAGWKVVDFKAEARPIYRRQAGRVISLAEASPAIAGAAGPAHQATIEWMRQPVGQVGFALNSYFSLLGSDASLGLVNAAQVWYARGLLAGTVHAGLPLLAAAAPFKAGGTGPDSFIDIAPGPVALREVADLYVFANTVAAVRRTGAEIAEWLERSAGLFYQISPTATGVQTLLNNAVPAYNFDVISGLTYEIDLSQPPRYLGNDPKPGASRRIVNLRFDGRPIDPAQEFVVVTNNYRADGGGGFPTLDGSRVVLRAPDLNRDAIVAYLRAMGTLQSKPAATWSFARPARPVRLAFRSAARLEALLDGRGDITRARTGTDGDGYTEYLLALG